MSHSITAIGTAFAELDDSDVEPTAKALRNLTQRLPFQPADRVGRADLYGFGEAAAMRLVYVAAQLGLTRSDLHSLLSWLHAEDRDTPMKADTLPAWPSRVVTAVERAASGEEFSIFIELRKGGEIGFSVNWKPRNPKSKTAKRILSAVPEPVLIARIEIMASLLITDLRARLA